MEKKSKKPKNWIAETLLSMSGNLSWLSLDNEPRAYISSTLSGKGGDVLH